MAASEPASGRGASSADDALPPDRGSLNPAPSGTSISNATSAERIPVRQESGASGLLGRTFESLGNRQYLYLWLSMMTGMSGTQMQFLARGILVFDLTGSFALTGLVGIGFAPAMLLGSLVSGTITERVERRMLIQATQFGQVALAGAVAVLLVTDALIWQHLLIASMLQGIVFSFMMPARQVMIPRIVGKELMSNAMALNSAAMSMTTMVAPAIGGVMYAFMGPEGVYFVVVGLNVVAIVFTGRVPKFPPDPNAPRRSMASNLVDGFSYVRLNRPLLSVIAFSATVTILSMPFRMLLPAFAKDVYGADPFQVGVLTAMTGIGSMAGAFGIAALRRGQRRGAVLMASAFVSAVALALAAGLPFYWAGIFLMIFIGVGEAGRFALGQALSMELTDDEHRARVASVFMMTFGLMPLGIMPVAFAMEVFGAETAIFGMAMVLLAVSTIFLFTMHRLRNLD